MTYFATIKQVLTLSCDESTQLVSASLERELTRGERLAVKLHALCCWSCRRFRRQILFFREAADRLKADSTSGEPFANISLAPDARQRISAALARGGADESV